MIQPTRQPTVQRPPAGQFVIQQPQAGVIQLGQQPHYRRISTGDAQFVAGAQPVSYLLELTLLMAQWVDLKALENENHVSLLLK